MATVETIDITSLIGSSDFPVNYNDVYGLVETIASQNIRALRSANRINDAFFEYDVENGSVIEEAVIAMAEKQTFVKTGAPNLAPLDPTLYVKYFNNWAEAQFQTATRNADIRKILANKGVGLEEVVSQILATLSEGESYYDYKQMRDMLKSGLVGQDASISVFGDKHPKNVKGIVYAMREMYNALKATNQLGNVPAAYAVPVEDIRIAVSESVLNLVDVTELANVFNLSKEELFGKLVVVPFDADFDPSRILVYDRKALGRGTRLFEYSQDKIGKGLYTNHYLTTDRCYFFNGLFKALWLDISAALAAGVASVMDDNVYHEITATLSHCSSDNDATEILEGQPYHATITADAGYTLTGASVTLTMGGVSIASTAYDDGEIDIASVTGDIVITITAQSE